MAEMQYKFKKTSDQYPMHLYYEGFIGTKRVVKYRLSIKEIIDNFFAAEGFVTVKKDERRKGYATKIVKYTVLNQENGLEIIAKKHGKFHHKVQAGDKEECLLPLFLRLGYESVDNGDNKEVLFKNYG